MEATYSLDIVTVEDPFSLSFLLPSLEGVVISDAEKLYPRRNSKQWKEKFNDRQQQEERKKKKSDQRFMRKEKKRPGPFGPVPSAIYYAIS